MTNCPRRSSIRMSQGLIVTDLKGRVIYANRAYADMTGATNAADVKTVEGLLSDVPEASAIVYRLASGLQRRAGGRRRVPAGAGDPARAPSPARAGTGCGPARSTCRASGSRWPPGRSPTSRASAPSRSASSSTCRRRSTISTMRRPASSPPTRKAASPISTPRSPNGWASTWRASRRATRTLPEIIAGDGMALVRSVRADPGTTRNAVIDLDLATVTGAGAAGALHAPRQRDPRGRARAEPHHRAQPHPRRGCFGRAAGIRDALHPLLQLDADGDRRRRPERPHPAHQRAVPVAVRLGRSTAMPSTARVRLDTVDPRTRPRRLRRGAREGQAAAGRHRADRHRAARQRRAAHPLLRQCRSPTAPAARAPKRRRSSMPSRRPSRRRSRARWRRARRCRRSASLPAASRTTSTTC